MLVQLVSFKWGPVLKEETTGQKGWFKMKPPRGPLVLFHYKGSILGVSLFLSLTQVSLFDIRQFQESTHFAQAHLPTCHWFLPRSGGCGASDKRLEPSPSQNACGRAANDSGDGKKAQPKANPDPQPPHNANHVAEGLRPPIPSYKPLVFKRKTL